LLTLVLRVEVGNPVFPVEHSNNNAKEDRDDRHVFRLLPSRSSGGKIQSREHPLFGQPGVRIRYFVNCLPSRQFLQDKLDGDACAGDDRLPIIIDGSD